MAWRRPGDKPLSEPMMVSLLTHICVTRPQWVKLITTHKYDDVIKWKHFLRYWPFVRVIPRSPVNSPKKDQWRGALMFSLICAWTNGWANKRYAGYLRRHRAHYGVIVINIPENTAHMVIPQLQCISEINTLTHGRCGCDFKRAK